MDAARRRPSSPDLRAEKSRSHAAVPVALVLVVVGFYLGRYTLVAPLLVGLVLLGSGLSLFSSRINPLSPRFYSNRKASWPAIGVVFLAAAGLLADAYYLWTSRVGTLLPHP